jgi:hypothetical protein
MSLLEEICLATMSVYEENVKCDFVQRRCGLDSVGSGSSIVAGSLEHGNGPSVSIIDGTERRGQVVNTPPSYSGVAEFKSRTGERYRDCGGLQFSSVPSGKCQYNPSN